LHWLLDEALLGDHGSGFLGFGAVDLLLLLGGGGLVVGFLVGRDGSFGFDGHGEGKCGEGWMDVVFGLRVVVTGGCLGDVVKNVESLKCYEQMMKNV